MSYQSSEISVDGGKPIELYRFVVAGTIYTYTSGQQLVNSNAGTGFGPEDYTPLDINRSNLDQTREIARSALTVTLPRDAAIATAFISFVPSSLVTLNIHRFHEGDTAAYVQFWKGRVKSVEWKESEAILHCEPTLTMLKRRGLRMNWGASCQHGLYDAGCGVLKAAYKTTALLTAVVDDVLTSTVIGTKPADWFLSGYAQRSTGETRFVVAQSGSTVTVLTPFNNLLSGETIDIYAGCKRDVETCFSKFNTTENPDALNFFGFHVNPKRNPFTTGLK